MNKPISAKTLNGTLILTKCTDGYWLWDATRGMNLAMRAKTETDAFVAALEYYQERLSKIESEFYDLKDTIDAFVEQIRPLEDEE